MSVILAKMQPRVSLSVKTRWLPSLVLIALLGLLIFQGYAYYFRLTLSLGPGVIFEPWAMRRGYLLYENLTDPHAPLMYFVIAELMPLFHDALESAKIILVALISLSTLLTFLAGRRTFGLLGGLGAALFFVIWSPVFGFGKLWMETFLAPIYLLLLLFYNPSGSKRSSKSLLFLGLLCGCAFLVKQHAVVVFVALISWSAFTSGNSHPSLRSIFREIGLIGLGAVLPVVGFTIYYLTEAGTLEDFWYWTVGFSFISGYSSLGALPPTGAAIGLIATACLLLPAAIFGVIDMYRKSDRRWLVLGWGLILVVTSSLTVYPRFAFFHLQAALPALAWISSFALTYALQSSNSITATYSTSFLKRVITIGLLFLSLITAGPAYLPVFRARQSQYVHEYTDLVPLANEIRQYIGPANSIYIFPDDEALSNLYYLTGCTPPKFWVYSYPWYMLDWIKARMLIALEGDRPQWIIYAPGRWDVQNNAYEIVNYVQSHYQLEAQLHWAQGDIWLLKRQLN